MPTLHVFLEDEVYEALRAEAERLGVKPAQLVKSIISSYVGLREKREESGGGAGVQPLSRDDVIRALVSVIEKLARVLADTSALVKLLEERCGAGRAESGQ